LFKGHFLIRELFLYKYCYEIILCWNITWKIIIQRSIFFLRIILGERVLERLLFRNHTLVPKTILQEACLKDCCLRGIFWFENYFCRNIVINIIVLRSFSIQKLFYVERILESLLFRNHILVPKTIFIESLWKPMFNDHFTIRESFILKEYFDSDS